MPSRPSSSPPLDPQIAGTLGSLRRRVRAYVWAQGLGATVAWACFVFWLSLAIDWFFEPVALVRIVLLVAGVGSIVLAAIRTLVRRVGAPLTDTNMAMLLERRYPDFDDALLTAVSLAPELDGTGGLYRDMLRRTSDEASRRVGHTRSGGIFNPLPLGMALMAAALLAVTVVAFAGIAPRSLGVWARRSLLLADELWPRRTGLAVEGFEGGVRKVARGTDLTIIATADLAKPLVPKTVEVRYRTAGGARDRAAMNREGEATPGRDRFQKYSYTFREILSPTEFELVGGDARLGGLRIEVVESPKIESLELVCEYPAYMDRSPRRVPVIGSMRIPRGARVTIEGRANKRLVNVRVGTATEGAPREPVVLPPVADVADGRLFRHVVGLLEKNATFLLTLHDADDIESAEPTRLDLVVVADEPPELSVALAGIGTAITPRARLPVVGQVRDDYGIAGVWIEYAVDQGKSAGKPIAAPSGNPTELAVEDALEAQDARVVPGQKLVVGLKASDRCDRKPARVGESPRWQLEVVTPERLRAMLQARELTLRYRFEQIIEEVSDTRDSLAQITFGSEGGVDEEKGESRDEKKPPSESATDRSGLGGAEPGDKQAGVRGREPGEQPDHPAASGAERRQQRLAAASLHCERAIQNSRKNANETLGTAEAFDDLRLQLINNRLDTEELKDRLGRGIVQPLRLVGDRMFPELERRLLALRETLGNDRAASGARDVAAQQVDAILTAMNQVLGRMMEMEDFNQVITLLQEIIQAQEKLEKDVRDRHKEELRNLLEEE